MVSVKRGLTVLKQGGTAFMTPLSDDISGKGFFISISGERRKICYTDDGGPTDDGDL